MSSIHGRGGMVYLQGSGATATRVAEAREWKFNIDRNLDESNRLGDSWVTQLMGLFKFTGSITGNWDSLDDSAFQSAIATTPRKFYFYPDGTVNARYYFGSIWPKIDIDAGFDKVIRFSMDFDGDGSISQN